MVHTKRIHLAILFSFFVASVAPVSAMQRQVPAGQAGQALNFIKSIFNFEYLNGDNNEYRHNSAFQKVINQPGRAFLTAAAYLGAAWVAKKLFDFAQKQGVFDDMVADRRPARAQNHRPVNNWQNQEDNFDEHDEPRAQRNPRVNPPRPGHNGNRNNNRRNQPNRPAVRPAAPANQPVRNDIRIADAFPGHQLNPFPQLGHLDGFYRMESHTPYQGTHNACGFNAVYNMALIEANLFGEHMDNAWFTQALENTNASHKIRMNGQRQNRADRQSLRDILGRRGLSNTEAVHLGRTLQLFPITVLKTSRAAGAQAKAREFHRNAGPCAAHFLCQVPGHWFTISVVKNAQDEQAMYLYDNLNNHPDSPAMVREYIQNIYHMFF